MCRRILDRTWVSIHLPQGKTHVITSRFVFDKPHRILTNQTADLNVVNPLKHGRVISKTRRWIWNLFQTNKHET